MNKIINILILTFLIVLGTEKVNALTITADDLIPLGFTDANFRTCVTNTFNSNASLTNASDIESGLKSMKMLVCTARKINEVNGLNYLTGLENLNLASNNLSNIDVSKNINLKTLTIDQNHLVNIDLSQNVNLTNISINDNDLTNIDVSKNTNMTHLSAGRNNLESVKFGQNTAMIQIFLTSNKLSELDVSDLSNLRTLKINDNNISFIDLSQNTQINFQNSNLGNNNFGNDNINIVKSVLKDNNITFEEYVVLPQNYSKTIKTYTSSDEEIATVDQTGKITLKKEGTVTITLTYVVNNQTLTEKNTLIITEKEEVSDDVIKNESNTKTDNNVKNPETSDKGIIYNVGAIALIGTIIVIKKKLKIKVI